jgi:hypothetical protein
MEQRLYDENGRMIKKIFGRSKEPGGMEFDNWATLEIWTYEYENTGKYVWVRPDDSFSSFYTFRKLAPEDFSLPTVEDNGNDIIMKDLSAIHFVNGSHMNDSHMHIDYSYDFDSDGNMMYSYHQYAVSFDISTGQEGEKVEGEEYNVSIDTPVIYDGNYPVSGEISYGGKVLYEISSITWRENGMPLRIEGPDGISEYDPDAKRYISTTRWDCQPGKPHDSVFIVGYWETYKYNEAGDLVEMQERFNEDSDQPWTRPTTWKYEYDEHGNWVRYDSKYMIAVDGPDGPVEDGYLTRAIEYY